MEVEGTMTERRIGRPTGLQAELAAIREKIAQHEPHDSRKHVDSDMPDDRYRLSP